MPNADDAELREAKRIKDDLDGTVNTRINSDDSALDDIKAKLEAIQNLSVINIAIQGAGFLSGAQELPIVSSLIEMDGALQRIEGTTGRMIPEAEHLITDLYTNAWGESRQAIAT